MTPRPSSTRSAISTAQIAIGVATIVRAPDIAVRPWLGLSRPAMLRIVRALGARQIVQGLVTGATRAPDVLLLGAGVDVTHAVTMLPVALIAGPYRKQAGTSATLALAVAASEFLTARAAK